MNRQHIRQLVVAACVSTWLVAPVPGDVKTPQTSTAVNTSDWDWGAMEGAIDTPTTSLPSTVASISTSPPIAPVARPDTKAKPKPAYALFPAMPEVAVIPAAKDMAMHPCGNCHRWVTSNTTPRILKTPHDNFTLKHGLHGRGQLWCFTCHDMTGNNGAGSLRTLEGEQLGFDEAYVLCTQCHAHKGRDWAFGAHGKRAANWQGPRQVYNCTACHYQHAPVPTTRTAALGPTMRQGLTHPAISAPSLPMLEVINKPTEPGEASFTSPVSQSSTPANEGNHHAGADR